MPDEKRELPYYERLRAERERLGIKPTDDRPTGPSRYEGKKAKDLTREERSFAFKSKGGTWTHPKTGAFISPSEAKRINRSAERRIIVGNIAKATGKTEKEVRAKLKGVSTNDIVGKWAYRSKAGETVRGHYKTTYKKDRKTGKRVKSRVLVKGPSAKGKKALRRLGIVAGAGALLRY